MVSDKTPEQMFPFLKRYSHVLLAYDRQCCPEYLCTVEPSALDRSVPKKRVKPLDSEKKFTNLACIYRPLYRTDQDWLKYLKGEAVGFRDLNLPAFVSIKDFDRVYYDVRRYDHNYLILRDFLDSLQNSIYYIYDLIKERYSYDDTDKLLTEFVDSYKRFCDSRTSDCSTWNDVTMLNYNQQYYDDLAESKRVF